ncbi:hypothetical protein ERS043973_02150, partial [Streptococcus pneumoniae]
MEFSAPTLISLKTRLSFSDRLIQFLLSFTFIQKGYLSARYPLQNSFLIFYDCIQGF